MKNILYFVINRLISLIHTTNIIIFTSTPDYSDNSYAIFKYLNENYSKSSKYRFVWLVTTKHNISKVSECLKYQNYIADVVYKYSFLAFWLYIRSRYVFCTHGLFSNFKLYQHNDKVIDMWHGMPLKMMGKSIDNKISLHNSIDYTISSGKLFQPIMAEMFGIDNNKVLITGQPRCDLFYDNTNYFIDNNIDILSYEKIGIWMPTFRKSIIGDIRIDGKFDSNKISFLKFDELDMLDSFLKELNTLLLIKIHPVDALQKIEFKNYTNIVIIKQLDFKYQLYPILGKCDFLLTDYSSVFIDYSILNRPIGFMMNDIDDYKSNRGFYFEDLEECLPGPILNNFDKLKYFIVEPKNYISILKFNDFLNSSSSKRLLSALKII